MSNEYMSTGDSTEDSMNTENPDPAEHLRTHRHDEVPAADAAVAGRPDLQPDSQGDAPLDAELGEDGQGDLAEGDGSQHSGDAPGDLRTQAPSGEVHEQSAQATDPASGETRNQRNP
ncbi:hypothetical protein [Microbacterium esteraromaticum]|uniref:hypothetical protein n=1 Tax=Microbacterium esteraromaticum TaxID=57043 RepID=UPI001959E1DB|nr:hypothetical protein [Microbacterium esteraromaticum]MBM7465484.1 hypothetical protein [Microbacterium esteraromaticum]